MDAQLKAKWLTMLRSGDYEQHYYNATDNKGKYCCVGVGGLAAGLTVRTGGARVGGEWVGSQECALALGLSHEQSQRLYNLNDAQKWTFSQIADWIETNI